VSITVDSIKTVS